MKTGGFTLRNKPDKAIAVLFLLFFFITPVYTDGFYLPENVEVRNQLSELFSTDPQSLLRERRRTFNQVFEPHRVQFRVAQQHGHVYLVFSNEVSYQFPVYSPGTYIAKRNLETGDLIQVKIFLGPGPESFLRIYPEGNRSRIDVHLLGRCIQRSLMLSVPINRVLIAPFQEVLRHAGNRINWEYFHPLVEQSPSEQVREIGAQVRERLGELPDIDDGALDDSGRWVFIETEYEQFDSRGFNCSGFAKYVVDGLVLPRTGSMLPIDLLKTTHPDFRGNQWSLRHEDSRDPYFGLDWSRNLALAAQGCTETEIRENPEAADVTDLPFLRYSEDVGYPVEEIEFALYLSSIQNPGNIYLGSVNQPYTIDQGPVLRQHVHLVVFFPWFDSLGNFHVDVMERNVETSVRSLEARYPGDFIHLVRIPAETSYSLPRLPEISGE
ncbi:MAG: hypothetical protein ACLFR1_01870 [Spirochaetia bacterium]